MSIESKLTESTHILGTCGDIGRETQHAHVIVSVHSVCTWFSYKIFFPSINNAIFLKKRPIIISNSVYTL